MLEVGLGSPAEAWIWRGGIAFLAVFLPALLLGHFSTPHGAASCPPPLRRCLAHWRCSPAAAPA
jgi:hypothetical protein